MNSLPRQRELGKVGTPTSRSPAISCSSLHGRSLLCSKSCWLGLGSRPQVHAPHCHLYNVSLYIVTSTVAALLPTFIISPVDCFRWLWASQGLIRKEKKHKLIEMCLIMWSFTKALQVNWASLVAQSVKNPPMNAGDLGLIPRLGRSPGEGKWPPTPVFLPGELHGQRTLVDYRPGGHRVRHDLGTNTTLAFSEKQKQQNINKHVERDSWWRAGSHDDGG